MMTGQFVGGDQHEQRRAAKSPSAPDTRRGAHRDDRITLSKPTPAAHPL
jgi:hypothetical protein